MIKSNVTVVAVEHDVSSGRGYYCAGRHCAVREQCHRHTSSVVQRNANFDDYDILMLSEGKCKYFVDVKETIQLGLGA